VRQAERIKPGAKKQAADAGGLPRRADPPVPLFPRETANRFICKPNCTFKNFFFGPPNCAVPNQIARRAKHFHRLAESRAAAGYARVFFKKYFPLFA